MCPAFWGVRQYSHLWYYARGKDREGSRVLKRKVKIGLRAQKSVRWSLWTFLQFESRVLLTDTLSKRPVCEGLWDKNQLGSFPNGPEDFSSWQPQARFLRDQHFGTDIPPTAQLTSVASAIWSPTAYTSTEPSDKAKQWVPLVGWDWRKLNWGYVSILLLFYFLINTTLCKELPSLHPPSHPKWEFCKLLDNKGVLVWETNAIDTSCFKMPHRWAVKCLWAIHNVGSCCSAQVKHLL